MILSLLFAFAVAIAAAFFAVANPTMVEISLFGYPVRGPVGLIVLLGVGLGVLVGVVVMLPTVISRSWTVTRQRRKLSQLEQKPAKKSVKKKK